VAAGQSPWRKAPKGLPPAPALGTQAPGERSAATKFLIGVLLSAVIIGAAIVLHWTGRLSLGTALFRHDRPFSTKANASAKFLNLTVRSDLRG